MNEFIRKVSFCVIKLIVVMLLIYDIFNVRLVHDFPVHHDGVAFDLHCIARDADYAFNEVTAL
ncbi:hypothetical protein D3C77_653720 [compost metagenome]